MARRPRTAHVIEASVSGRRHTFIATSAPNLAQQLRATFPAIPAALLDNLARLTVDHQARLELPQLLTIRHTATLTQEQPHNEATGSPRRPAEQLARAAVPPENARQEEQGDHQEHPDPHARDTEDA